MILRIYAQKNNTIASGLYAGFNSGQNAVSDLWYGGGGTDTALPKRNSYSRYIASFDLTDLSSKIYSKEINSGSNVTYRIKMKNAIPRNKILDPEYEFDNLENRIASSFDLICFPINKDFDEGRGYDMFKEHFLVKQRSDLPSTGYSNWNFAKLSTPWDAPGIFLNPTASTSSYAMQHFDIGDEDINMDITTMVNQWIASGATTGNLAIAFRRDYELLSTDTRYISSFYTIHTNTAFKPFIEVSSNQSFKDDRNDVTNNRICRLFLYTFSGNSPANFYSSSTVSIKTYAGADVQTGLIPNQLEKGVYYVDVLMSAATKGTQYKDVWCGVTFNMGYDKQDYTQFFTIQDNYYFTNAPQVNAYSLSVYGIENDSILTIGDVTRIYCDLKVNYTTNYPKTKYDIQYRMVMNNQEEVIPWSSMNQAIINKNNSTYFVLDTSWLLHNQAYQIQFKIKELGTSRLLPEIVNFRVMRPF